ncbi:MAG TPA: carboxypeptidase-like regulatory domain-containing protein [Thermoanaerobaculia bacterium]|jgi:hypothetical protein|nr:carboxypeptidase-like regulatory domain-containing protein [Thermoanaerobaculia bacterium]
MKRSLALSLLIVALLSSCKGSPTEPRPLAIISGTVTDRLNRLVTAANVSLVPVDSEVFRVVNTGDTGRYSIGPVAPGRYHLYVTLGRSGTSLFHAELELHDGMNPYDIVVQ